LPRPGIATGLIEAIKEGSILWIYFPEEQWLVQFEFLVLP